MGRILIPSAAQVVAFGQPVLSYIRSTQPRESLSVMLASSFRPILLLRKLKMMMRSYSRTLTKVLSNDAFHNRLASSSGVTCKKILLNGSPQRLSF